MGAVQEGRKKKRKAGADDGAKDSSTTLAASRVAVKSGVSNGSLNGSAAEQPVRGRRENTEEIKSKKRRRMAAAAAASSAPSSSFSSPSSSSSAPAGEASRGAGFSGAKASPAAPVSSTANQMKKAPAAAATAAAAPGGGEDLVAGMVSRQLLRRALAALTQFVLKRSSSSSNDSRGRPPTPLLQEPGSETVSLMVSLRQIPTHFKKTPILIELPHSLLDNNSEVCLIVKDPQRKWKDILSSQVTPKQQPLLIPHITKVIGVKKLKKKFPTYKDRRMLCAAFDLFVVDKKVLNQAYEALGKSFAQAKKLPLPVRLSSTNPRPWLETALRSTAFFLPRGPSIAVKIGRACMQQQQLEENACAALQALQQFFSDPTNKWRNTIHTVAVQATDAPALPLFVHPAYAGAAAAAAAEASAAAAAPAKRAPDSATAAAAGVSGGGRGPAPAGGGSSGGGGRAGMPSRKGKTKKGRNLPQPVQKKDAYISKKAAAARKEKNAKKMKKNSRGGAAPASPATSSAGRKTGKGGKKTLTEVVK